MNHEVTTIASAIALHPTDNRSHSTSQTDRIQPPKTDRPPTQKTDRTAKIHPRKTDRTNPKTDLTPPHPQVIAPQKLIALQNPQPQNDRQKGSHAIYKNNDGCRVVIPIHSGKDIKQGTLMGMIQDIGIDKETFFELLRK